MDGQINLQYTDTYLLNGNTLFLQAVDESSGTLTKNLDANGYKIINLATGTNSQDATNLAQVQYMISQAQIDPAQLPSLNAINDTIPLDGDLDFRGPYDVFVNNNGTGASNKPVTGNDLVQNNTEQRAITDQDIADSLQAAKDYTDQEIATLTTYINQQDQIILQDAKDYTDQEILDLKDYVDTQDQTLQTQITNNGNKTISEISTQNPNNGNIDINGYKITGSSVPTQNTELTNKLYVDLADEAVKTEMRNYTDTRELQNFGIGGDLDLDGYRILNLGISGLPSSAATVGEVNTTSQTAANNALNSAKTYTDQEVAVVADDLADLGVIVGQNTTNISTLQSDVNTLESNSDKIYNSTSQSQIQCFGNNEIRVKSNNVQIGKIYQAVGQVGFTPMAIEATDRFQFVTPAGSSTMYSTKALSAQPAINANTFTVNSLDNIANNVVNQIQIGGGASQRLTLASGHFNLGVGMQQFSSISNSSDAPSIQQSLLMSAGTPLTDPTLTMYSNSFATTLGTNIPIQFQGKTGYSTTTAITENNQFASKAYVDSTAGSGGIENPLTQDIDADNTYTLINCIEPVNAQDVATKNYVDTALLDYYPDTTRLDQIVAPTASLDMNSQKIINVLNPTLSQDAVTLNYLQTNNYTKTESDDRYYLDTTPLQSITAPSASLSMNSQKIINCLDPTNNQDVATKYYVDQTAGGSVIPSPSYFTTLTTLTNGAIATVTHNLNLALNQLDIKPFFIIKTGVTVNGFSAGQIIEITSWTSDMSSNGKSEGVSFTNIDANSFRIICGGFGVCNALRGGTSGDQPVMINFNQVDVQLYVQQRASPAILQANSLNTDQLIVNSNLNFATGGYRVQGADPTNATDYTTKQWVEANVAVGVPPKIQNAVITTSSLTCNQTEITNGSTNLNMNAKQIKNGIAGTASTDFVILSQLDKIQSPDTTNFIQTTNSQFRMKKASRSSDYMTIQTSTNQMVVDADEIQLYANGQIMQVLTSSQNRMTRKMKLSSSGVSAPNGFYLDSSLNTGTGANMRIVTVNTTDIALEVNTGQILHSGRFISSGDVNIYKANDALVVLGNESTLLPDSQSELILSYANLSVWGLNCYDKYIQAGAFVVYPAPCERKRKKDIIDVNFEGLDQVTLKRFFYDETKYDDVYFKPDFNKQQFGVIIEQDRSGLPLRYQVERTDNVTGAITINADIGSLKDDLLSYHQEMIKQQQQRIIQLESTVGDLTSKLNNLIQILGVSV